jgi:hypothetical protein
MKHILDRYKVGWIEEGELPAGKVRVQHVINELDAVAVRYEKIWGVDRLPRLVGDELYQKWQRQMEKLDTALLQNDEALVMELAAGCAKGWQVMDAEARANGHQPPQKPEAWHVRMGDKTLAVVATEDDAMVLQAHLPPDGDVVIWPLSSIAHVIGELYRKTPSSNTTRVEPKAVLHNDDMPF